MVYLYGVNECSSKYRKAIQKQIQKCIALVKKDKYLKSNSIPNNDFLSFEQLVKLENFKLGYKIKNKELPSKIIYMVSHDKNKRRLTKQHKYNTRNKTHLSIPKHSTMTYHKSFLVSSIRDFSTLPLSVSSTPSFQPFVHKC